MTPDKNFTLKRLVLALNVALAAMASPALRAADTESLDPAVAALTKPANSVDVGAEYVSDKSAKFGEYNGLDKKGWYGLLGFDVRGGPGYGSLTDPTRWSLFGSDLGLDTRKFTAGYGQQGRFQLNFGYEGIVHNVSDTYQTPYDGAGGNNFTLPSNWLAPRVPQVSATGVNFRSLSPVTGLAPALVNGVSTPPTAAQQAIVNNIQANDLPAFHNVDLNTKRDRYDGAFSYNLSPQWIVKGSVRREDKKGLKALGSVSSQVSENSVALPEPIDHTTDQFRLSSEYVTERFFVQVAYYGSVFRNHVDSYTWQDVMNPLKTATMAEEPDNEYHRVGLTGGYNFSRTMKLVADAAYARNTQDQGFVTQGQNNQLPLGLPTQSLHGEVITKKFSVKLTDRPVRDVSLAAAYKYDDRDNRTPINTYIFQDANEAASGVSPFNIPLGLAQGTLGSNINIYNNRPYSKKLNQANLDGSWRFHPGQSVDLGYEYQQIDRNCPGAWIDCADADRTKENTGRIEWTGTVVPTLTARASYAYSERRVGNYNENAFLALVPMANVLGVGGAATNGSTVATQSALAYLLANGLTGYGPIAGYAPPYTGNTLIYGNNGGIIPQALYGSRNNINELPGMRRFNMADRNRDKLRSLLNWEANEQLSLQAGADYNKDDYDNSVFGLKSARSYALNFDGTYAVDNDFTATAYYTYEDIRSKTAGDAYGSNSNTASVNGFTAINPVVCYATIQARNLNGKQDPCLMWDTDMRDKVDTLGLALRKGGLMGGRLRLGGDVSYTRQQTDVDVHGGSYANNPLALAGAPAGTVAAFYIAAQPLPTTTVKILSASVNAQYALDRHASIGAMYLYQKLEGMDWRYFGMQYGTGTNYLPTNEQFPAYRVHVVGVAYSYRF